MIKKDDWLFALAVIVGAVDRKEPSIPERLANLKSKGVRTFGLGELDELVEQASATHAVAVFGTPAAPPLGMCFVRPGLS